MEERVNADNANVKKDLWVNVANSKTVNMENVLMRKKRFVVELEMQLVPVKTVLQLDKNRKYFNFNNFTETSNILIHLGKGECKLSYNFTDCEGEITGECDCNIVNPNQESMYNGTFCDCCKSGPCQTHCFNRYALEDGGEEDMCSNSGKCSCYERSGDAKQRVGEKCKVNRTKVYCIHYEYKDQINCKIHTLV